MKALKANRNTRYPTIFGKQIVNTAVLDKQKKILNTAAEDDTTNRVKSAGLTENAVYGIAKAKN